jgi:formylmethanofuran dehydrogenase subunit E
MNKDNGKDKNKDKRERVMLNINEIGVVKSKYKEPANAVEMREAECLIEIKSEFTDGLYRLEEHDYLDIVFCFHKSENYELKQTNRFDEFKGVFATRSPKRPSNIGLTRVKLLKCDENILHVKGLDAIDGTPILDIKPIDNGFMSNEKEKSKISELKQNPRKHIISLVKNNKIEEIMALAGSLHGHYCPGLAMGVIGSVYSVNKINEFSDGMENILAVLEINSCFTDGIQYVTGCTPGNNSLIYRDFGKTAFSLVKRDGIGIRLTPNISFRGSLSKREPEFSKYYNLVVAEKNRDEKLLREFKKSAQKACFNMIQWDIEDIFKIKEVKLKVPDYAPVRESIFCCKCDEEIMKEKEIIKNGEIYCKGCGKDSYFQLDGSGISVKCGV